MVWSNVDDAPDLSGEFSGEDELHPDVREELRDNIKEYYHRIHNIAGKRYEDGMPDEETFWDCCEFVGVDAYDEIDDIRRVVNKVEDERTETAFEMIGYRALKNGEGNIWSTLF